MFDDDVNRIPASPEDMWQVLREQFEFILANLVDLPIESREDALENSYHWQSADERVHRDNVAVIRYRNVSPGLNLREYYLEMVDKLIPLVAEALEREVLTPAFVQQWGQLQFCHGFIASYIFDDSDDLSAARGGKKDNRLEQRRWMAHILESLLARGVKRKVAAKLIEEALCKILHYEEKDEKIRVYLLEKDPLYGGFKYEWYKAILNGKNLFSTYDRQHFTPNKMRALLALGADGLPPIPEFRTCKS